MSRAVKRYDLLVPLKEKLEADPITAPVVVRIYDWADEGKTLKWIARALSGGEEGGIYKSATPRQHTRMAGANADGEWEQASLHRILEFPGYMGKWPAYRTKRVPRNDGSEHHRQVPVPEEEWVWVEPSPAPALVTPEQWHRVQVRLANNKLYATRRRKHVVGYDLALLQRGMVRCGATRPDGTICNAPMDAHIRSHQFDKPDATRTYQYICRASKRTFPDCKGLARNADALDRAVQLTFVDLLRQPDVILRLARRSQAHDLAAVEGIKLTTPVDTYAAKKKELAEKELAVTNLTERSATLPAGDAAVIGYELTICRLGSEIETLRVVCDNARRAAEKYERVEQSVGEWKDYLATAQDNVELLGDLNTLSRPEIRAMHRRWQEALGARVIVHPIGSELGLATLQLHLNQLDLSTARTRNDEVPLAVQELPVAPEPVRHGGKRAHELPYTHPATISADQFGQRWTEHTGDVTDDVSDAETLAPSDVIELRSRM